MRRALRLRYFGDGRPVGALLHRDKNYTRNRLKSWPTQTITGDNWLEMERGCGPTEALYALVEQVMEPSAQIRTASTSRRWAGERERAALQELESF